jgi:hypothetical protein
MRIRIIRASAKREGRSDCDCCENHNVLHIKIQIDQDCLLVGSKASAVQKFKSESFPRRTKKQRPQGPF